MSFTRTGRTSASALVFALSSALLSACSQIPAESADSQKVSYLHHYTRVQDGLDRQKHLEVAYLAGGCFWGMQDALDHAPGVVSTVVGYCGGTTTSPTYESVCRHDTGHAETVRVVFDPNHTAYKELVDYFLDLHDPTTLNRQGPDIEDQYRSAVFFYDEEQNKAAASAICGKNRQLEKSGEFARKDAVVTALEPFKTFYSAEPYHQNYFARSGQASCHRTLRHE